MKTFDFLLSPDVLGSRRIHNHPSSGTSAHLRVGFLNSFFSRIYDNQDSAFSAPSAVKVFGKDLCRREDRQGKIGVPGNLIFRAIYAL